MADQVTFEINAKDNASAALNKISNNLGNLQKKTSAVEKSFSGLRSALGGLAIGAAITNLLKFADGLDDVSKATNIALSSVIGFGQAVQANGGTLEDANNALTKFVITIGEAADGSGKVQQAFAKVGVSLQDLRNLSEEDILRKTVDGLSKIADTSARAKLQTELFGKAFKGIDASKIAGDFNKASKGAEEYAASVKKAAEVQQVLEQTINSFKLELLNALSPITDFIGKLDKEQIRSFTQAITQLAVSLGTLAAVMKSFQIIATLLLGGFAMMKKGAGQVGNTSKTAAIQAKGFSKAWEEASGVIQSAAVLLVGLLARLKNLGFLLGGIVRFIAPLYAVAEILARLASGGDKGALDYLDQLINKFKELIGIKTEAEKFDARKFGAREATPAESGVFFPGAGGDGRDVKEDQGLKQKRNSILDIADAYKKQGDQVLKNLQNEQRSYTMSKDTLEIVQAQESAYDDAIKTIEELYKIKSNLSDEERSLAPVIDQQISAIEKNIAANQQRVTETIKGIQQMRMAEEDLRRDIQATADAFRQSEALQDLQDQLDLIGLYGEELEKQQTIMAAEKALREEMQRLTVELLQLEAERTRIGEEAYNKERQRVTQQMMDAKALSEAKIAAFEKEQEKKKALEESYQEGVKRALDDIADSYKPINMAQEAVKKGWSSIENAIDTFVDTGKFKFADFARSVIQDLAKMIAKALIFKAISSALGAFGLKIPGLAAGGPVEAGKAYMVGEKGPELFVPTGSGKIVPNDKIGSNGGGQAMTGPITNNYNTYNINALDAKSVAQMFAENRKAIFGANKMAEREMSYAGVR
jgi:lambda family phage tail tape measure protein